MSAKVTKKYLDGPLEGRTGWVFGYNDTLHKVGTQENQQVHPANPCCSGVARYEIDEIIDESTNEAIEEMPESGMPEAITYNMRHVGGCVTDVEQYERWLRR